MARQFRYAMQQPGGKKGHVAIAEILSMAEESLVESWDPAKHAHLNATVGYFINSDGYLDYDVFRLFRQANGGCDIDASGEVGARVAGAAGAAGA
eukprot:3905871-Prymnesium_polylepis.1